MRAPLESLLGRTAAFLALFAFGPLAVQSAPSLSPFDDDEKEEEEAEDEEPGDAWFAAVGGDVYTGTGAILRGATVLAKNGKIEEIGYDLLLPEGTETLDAAGYRVYPGLVAVTATSRLTSGGFMAQPPRDLHARIDSNGKDTGHSQAGGHDEHSEPELALPDDDIAVNEEITTWTRTAIEDSFDPFGSYLILALATGITSAQQSSVAVKLKRFDIGDIQLSEKYYSTYSFSSRNPTGKAAVRKEFQGARRYIREYRAWEEKKKSDKELKEPSKKGVSSKALSVLRGETRAYFSSSDQNDLLGIARLAQEFNFRPVINGCGEGWIVADELGRAGATAIINPRYRRDKPESQVGPGGSSIENAAILHAHGVQVAIAPASSSIDLGGITGRDLMHLPIEAGFAIRGGLPERAALDAITTIPARLMGIEDRVGTLEVGKDCDLIVTDGDVLHYQTFVQYTVVEGEVVYDKEDEIFFAHIRPRPESEDSDEGHVEDHDEDEGHEEGEGEGEHDD